MPICLRVYGTSDPVAASALKQQLQHARLPTNELTRAERERKQREKQEAKQREQQRKKTLKEAAQQAAGVRHDGARGQQIENNENPQWANVNTPTQDSSIADPSMESIMESTVRFNPREVGEVADKYGSSEEALSQLPFAQQPSGLLTNLLPFQLQGLAWMLDRENPRLPPPGSKDTTQLWKANMDGSYTHIATQYTTKDPKLASGGILADDMGLGKTIQVLSLLVADPQRGSSPTLIVCPLSVMSNWSHQAQIHIRAENGLKVLVYHGTNRENQRPQDFMEYDIVITTYQTMALEYMPGHSNKPSPMPRKTGLFSFEWRRIVLDEGHTVRNPKSKMTLGAHALMASSRWVITGTPIVNNLRDLQSHIKFIRLTGGLEQNNIFTGTLMRPLNQQRPEAQILLQALMNTICLRRMKDMKFVDLKLPELESHRYSVPFEAHERVKYDAFAQEAKGILVQFQTRKNAQGQNTYGSLLEVLLRMRQSCNHWKMCGDKRITDLLELAQQNQKIELNPENLQKLRDLLQLSIDSQEECSVCYESLHNPTITSCAHVFGAECIERVIEIQHKCPMCRGPLQKEDLVQPVIEEQVPPFDADTSSSKIEALLNILKATRKSNPDNKTVIFSQWTSFLDIVGRQLEKHNFNFCRLDGTMNPANRDKSLSRLENEQSCTIMLASLSVCGVGLNLVAANQVIMSDSWWAPAIEDQAVDRVHRLGQKKPVTVFRLVMEDSIEDRVLDIQTEKRRLMMAAFGEKTMKRGSEKSARLQDIERLLK